MNNKDAAETLHKEHEQMARLLAAFETALKRAGSKDDETRSPGLAELREVMDQGTRIRGSHPQDSETLNSPVFQLVDNVERVQLKQNLFQLERDSYEFRKQLAFTTTLSTEELVEQGRHLLDSLRKQIAYEQQLLQGFEANYTNDSKELRLKE